VSDYGHQYVNMDYDEEGEPHIRRCQWCLASPLSSEGQRPCPEIAYREASDRLRASRLARQKVVHEGDRELAEYFGQEGE
jgi:hypothetical protein